jgi:alkaline phosphatase
MTAGVKTFNNSVNVGSTGEKLSTISHELQQEGRAVGVVTSVPICHATPASAYAHNVSRSDYQDLSRDLLGLPSVAHPENPLPGMDVVIGCGYGKSASTGQSQGANFVPGNIYLTDADLKRSSADHGGRYVTAVRETGVAGNQRLLQAAAAAAKQGHRLLGFYGMGEYNGHLPFQTANGDYAPVAGTGRTAEHYSAEDLNENPTLAQMTTAALTVLAGSPTGFWLMVEAGDVDWANHDNNLDNSIGAVNSGDAAVKTITDWVEQHSNWTESILIVTADHGHLLRLTHPELLAGSGSKEP